MPHDPANGIWIDNVHNIASYVKEKRGEKPFLKCLFTKILSIQLIRELKIFFPV